MSKHVEKVKITLEFEVQDVDALYDAAKASLEKLREEAVSEYGENEDQLYAQPMDQLIREQLYDEAGELHLSSCITAVLDPLIWNVPGAEFSGSTAESIK